MSLKFDLEADAGQIRLAVLENGEPLWPHPDDPNGDGASEFDPEDVLAFIADAWGSLLLSQSWPIAFDQRQEPRSITGLLRAAEARWDSGELTEPEIATEARLVESFLQLHDLSSLKHGAGLASCFVLRQNDRIRIETQGKVIEGETFAGFLQELLNLGEASAALLRERGDDRARRVVERWEAKDRIEPVMAAALISGVDPDQIRTSNELIDAWVYELQNRSVSQLANDNQSPILAAARSSGPLGPSAIATILRAIRAFPSGDMAQLARIRTDLRRHMHSSLPQNPTSEGVRAATWIREWGQYAVADPVDLNDLAAKLRVKVERQRLGDSRLDGIAIAGPEHGPAIILNMDTRRQGAGDEDLERSLNFTMAHELGHLLQDQDEWPGLIDASAGRTPRHIEVRANAFATYLLLPLQVAGQCWIDAGKPIIWPDLEDLLNNLTQRFGLPRIAAARQVARAGEAHRLLLERVFEAHISNYCKRCSAPTFGWVV